MSSGWIEKNGNYSLGDFVSADLTLGYTFSDRFSKRNLAEIKNILDKKYEVVAGYPEEGRLFMVGVNINANQDN